MCQTVGAICQNPNATNYMVTVDGDPQFLFGALREPAFPHVAQIWGLASSRFKVKHLVPVSRFIREQFVPDLKAAGVRRAEVRVSVDNRHSVAWLERALGAQAEGVLENFGRHGEDFVLLSWIHRPS